jgi:hypothetical protein
LIPPFPGSNPSRAASQCGLGGRISWYGRAAIEATATGKYMAALGVAGNREADVGANMGGHRHASSSPSRVWMGKIA